MHVLSAREGLVGSRQSSRLDRYCLLILVTTLAPFYFLTRESLWNLMMEYSTMATHGFLMICFSGYSK